MRRKFDIIDESERIVLPVEVRKSMKWDQNIKAEIWVNPQQNEIVIKKHIVDCVCCGKTKNLKAFDKKHICEVCQKKIVKLQ